MPVRSALSDFPSFPAFPRFDLVDLRLFLNVVDSGSITAGCKLSHLALASASSRIRGIEEALGVALLERSRSGVRLTPAGEAVEYHARLVLQQLERMQGEIGEYAGGLAGKVRLLANTAAVTDYLPEALSAFLTVNPGIDIDLQERPSHMIVSQLTSRVADLGILADSADTVNLQVRPFRRDQLVLVMPRNRAPARRCHLSFAEALKHEFVGLDEDSAMQQHLNQQAERLGLRMRTRIRLRGFDAVCRMVEANVGIAVVPAVSARRYAGLGKLRVLTLEDSWADRQLLICAREFNQLSAPALKLVTSLCAEDAGGLKN